MRTWAPVSLLVAAGLLTGCGVSSSSSVSPTVRPQLTEAAPQQPHPTNTASETHAGTLDTAGSLYGLVGLVAPSETPLLPAKVTAQP